MVNVLANCISVSPTTHALVRPPNTIGSLLASAALLKQMLWLMLHASGVLPIMYTHAEVLYLYSHNQESIVGTATGTEWSW